MPLYLVATGEGEAKKERLIDANNINAARNHAAKDTIKVERAGQADLFRLAKAGVDVETVPAA